MQLDEIIQRLQKLDTACVCDADKSVRVLDSAIRPINGAGPMVGVARTVSCVGDFLPVIQALAEAQPGEVLVVDGGGEPTALAGGLFSTEAQRRGLAGIVVDGGVRDVKVIVSLSIPVYARWTCPRAGTTQMVAKTQVPITCGGVEVRPGDVLFGDRDGIVAASLDDLTRLLPVAEGIQQKEEVIFARMKDGTGLVDMLNFEEHVAALNRGDKSALKFKL